MANSETLFGKRILEGLINNNEKSNHPAEKGVNHNHPAGKTKNGYHSIPTYKRAGCPNKIIHTPTEDGITK